MSRLDALIEQQSAMGLSDVHLVYVGLGDFYIAHTDAERAGGNLEGCPLHEWLSSLHEPPAEVGTYVAVRHGGSDPWDFDRLD